jgi:RecA/RadA recombinase
MAMTVNGLVQPGEIGEIVGRLASGRTSLLVRCLRAATAAGGTAALVDVDSTFDPPSAQRAGVDLGRVLWVRGDGDRDRALKATDVLIRCPGFALVALDLGESVPRLSLSAAFRWKLAVRRARVALLVAGRRRLTGSAAALCVETSRAELAWAGPRQAPTRLMAIGTSVTVLRATSSPRQA